MQNAQDDDSVSFDPEVDAASAVRKHSQSGPDAAARHTSKAVSGNRKNLVCEIGDKTFGGCFIIKRNEGFYFGKIPDSSGRKDQSLLSD
jgi:hypothetical protein